MRDVNYDNANNLFDQDFHAFNERSSSTTRPILSAIVDESEQILSSISIQNESLSNPSSRSISSSFTQRFSKFGPASFELTVPRSVGTELGMENEESEPTILEPLSSAEFLSSLLKSAEPSISAALPICSDSVVPLDSTDSTDSTTLQSLSPSSSSISSTSSFAFRISSPCFDSLVTVSLLVLGSSGHSDSDNISLITPATMSRVLPIASATSPFPAASEVNEISLELTKLFCFEQGLPEQLSAPFRSKA
mmetsp:Transcript_21030/g.49858  ORF Transcript_21030/g.49858 Transcript_21030/m.49858 type:complete len:250 (-) Transcript_21030:2108-2857(-)